MAKFVYILAGPNGSGKSTFHKGNFSHLPFINPDLLQQGLPPNTPSPEIAAGRLALAEIQKRFLGDTDFVVETTLTGNAERRLFEQATHYGWEIKLHYVCLSTLDEHIHRIEQRFQNHGHYIPAEVVARRYERSLENLPKVLPKADTAWLYDNSSRTGFEVVAKLKGGQVVYQCEPLPAWAKRVLR
jgi:predicted ABC-type ATPase